MGFRFCYYRKTTNTKNLTLKFNNKIEGEIPIEALLLKRQYMIENGLKKT